MSEWTLVTGANGFLGARLVRKLVERGHKVRAFVRPGSNLRELEGLPNDRVRLAVGDVTIVDRVYAGLRGCSRLYHVAAQTEVDERRRDETIRTAAGGTRATLEAARLAKIDKVVVTSSLFALGVCEGQQPLTEESQFALREPNGYAQAKKESESIALDYAQRGMNLVVVNPAMLIGPGDHRPTPTGQTIVNYLNTSPTFRIPMPPGGLNYADVDAVAEGHIAAMDKGKRGERYILGGEDLTHQDFVQMMADITGLAEPGKEASEFKLRVFAWFEERRARARGRRASLTQALIDDYYGRFVYVSSAKAEEELGYDARPVRPALLREIAWYLEHGYAGASTRRRVRLESLEAQPASAAGG